MTHEPPDTTPPAKPGAFELFIGSGFLSGYSPIASGTVGSAFAAAIYYLVPGFEGPYIIMPLIVAFFLYGIHVSDKMEVYYGHDPAQVTVDEVVGMWLSFLLLPKTLVLTIAGFFIFRVLDIVKPFPARRFEQQKGGFGIMMDDVVAGFYSNLLLHVLAAVLQYSGQ